MRRSREADGSPALSSKDFRTLRLTPLTNQQLVTAANVAPAPSPARNRFFVTLSEAKDPLAQAF